MPLFSCLRDWWHVAIPLLLGIFATILLAVFTPSFGDFIPHSFNATAWQRSVSRVNETLHMHRLPQQIAFLLTIHCAQVLLLLPMMHVTKILYGFWLGPVFGWLLCCAWELLLIFAYISRLEPRPHADVTAIVSDSRARGRLFPELVLLALSSTPLQIDGCLLQFGGVTVCEFWSANLIVTCVMTFKNTLAGYLLAASGSAATIAAVAIIISASTLIPTFATAYVSSKTIYQCFRIYQTMRAEHENTTTEKTSEASGFDEENTLLTQTQ